MARLSKYRQLLQAIHAGGETCIYSHQIAAHCNATAAQVRRDLMGVGYVGTPQRGYAVKELLDSLSALLDAPQGHKIALVGIGHLGRALLDFLQEHHPRLVLVAAFDIDPGKTNRVMHGVHCHPLDTIREVVRREGAEIGVICVPATAAQDVADRLVDGGIRGVLNFAPVVLRLPRHVYVEHLDITMFLEKVAFFGRHRSTEEVVGP